MLIAPLVDGQRLVGLIQVFSSWPNAFGKREISALQVLAGRIAESNREAETVITTPVEELETPVEERETPVEEQDIPVEELEIPVQELEAPAEPAEFQLEPVPNEAAEEQPEQLRETIPAPASAPRKGFDLSSTVLVVLVIVAAIALGLVIGWRRAAELTKPPRQVNSSVRTDAPSISQTTVPTASQNAVTADPLAIHPESAPVSTTKAPIAKAEPPPGGLIVTQNGKVVYRSSSGGGQPVGGQEIERPLIHRVEPEYPAEAEARHVEGPVVLDVEVLGNGKVGTIAVVSGDPVLAKSAINAVKHWRYRPASADGQGVRRQTRVTVNFTLPQS